MIINLKFYIVMLCNGYLAVMLSSTLHCNYFSKSPLRLVPINVKFYPVSLHIVSTASRKVTVFERFFLKIYDLFYITALCHAC